MRDSVITAVAAAFSVRLMAGAGYAAVYEGVLFLFVGVIVHAVLAARRQRHRHRHRGTVPCADKSCTAKRKSGNGRLKPLLRLCGGNVERHTNCRFR